MRVGVLHPGLGAHCLLHFLGVSRVSGILNFCPKLSCAVCDCKYAVYRPQLCFMTISMDLRLFKIIKIEHITLKVINDLSVGRYIMKKPKHSLRAFTFFSWDC